MHSNTFKGIIALDIDGTITSEAHTIDYKVIDYLKLLNMENWLIVFITGRPFSWAWSVLSRFPFPYFFAVQNGATLLEMPGRIVRNRRLLDFTLLPTMESICKNERTDFVIYTGYDNGDQCYFRPHRLSDSLKNYLKKRSECLQEKWIPVDDYDHLPITNFASLKCFAKEEQARRLVQIIECECGLHVPLNRDPFDSDYYVIQATHPDATKGCTLNYLKQMTGISYPIIAAGDDGNDLSMLMEADIKVVMATAPDEILKVANIIAPPASSNGIIEGLQHAIGQALS